MKGLAEILEIPPYSLDRKKKEEFLNPLFSDLCRHHYDHCDPYRRIADAAGFDVSLKHNIEYIPFIPVRLFKMFDLYSVPKENIVKTLTSSGTSGQAVSKIYLDRETSAAQTKALAKIVTSFIGNQRLPMIIIDSENAIRDRDLLSARGAGILGFSFFGSRRIFALNDRMEPDINKIVSFLDQHKDQRKLLFGFTWMVYRHFYKPLAESNVKIDLSDAVLIHGGGWKKLAGESVSPSEFRGKLRDTFGIRSVHDYYGMAEQTGSIFMECEEGYFHAPLFSDIIIRRPLDFSVADHGENGIVQVLSVLPESYPGHSLLTEDEGVIIGEDDCKCGRKGKYFRITGRLKNAEVRGCSDTYGKTME